jgi:SAM-dependent methyltransferase
MKFDLAGWPSIDRSKISTSFREVPLEAYPELASLERASIHDGLAGQGGLFLASDMTKLLSLRRGMRVLDLGCGAGVTSVFLARRFGVTVYAVDAEIPNDLMQRAAAAGVEASVIPVRSDARSLPFSPGFFDAVFSMNAFFYFGTDDLYPSYLLRFLKPGGEIVIGCPCYRDEITHDTPEEFLLEFPACLAVHSPQWWHRHFEKARNARVLQSSLHPRGAEFWEDRVRYLLEEQDPREMSPSKRDMVYDMIRMLNRDSDGFVSHFILHAKKEALNQTVDPTVPSGRGSLKNPNDCRSNGPR